MCIAYRPSDTTREEVKMFIENTSKNANSALICLAKQLSVGILRRDKRVLSL
jgi:hypothetical protein